MARNSYFIVSKELAADKTISATAKLLFAQLLEHRNRKTGRCHPWESTLAGELGVSRWTVIRQLAALKTAGLIDIKRTQKGNRYEFPMLQNCTSPSCILPPPMLQDATFIPSYEPNPMKAAASSGSEIVPAAAAAYSEENAKPKPPARATSDPGVFAFVRASLNSLAEVTRMPVPDDDLVWRVIEAAPGASGEEIHEALKWLYQSDRLRNMRSWGYVLLKLADLARKAATA